MSNTSFFAALQRSKALRDLIDEAWAASPVPVDLRQEAVVGLCGVSIDHGHALQMLLAVFPGSGIALLRPQSESLVRAVWAAYAASERDISSMVAPLTLESQKSAKRLPDLRNMLAAVEKAGHKAAATLLKRAHSRLWEGLNSFIHAGIHPLARERDGYPAELLEDVLKNSNGMSLLTLIILAELAEDPAVLELIRALNVEFSDVLPDTEPL